DCPARAYAGGCATLCLLGAFVIVPIVGFCVGLCVGFRVRGGGSGEIAGCEAADAEGPPGRGLPVNALGLGLPVPNAALPPARGICEVAMPACPRGGVLSA